MCALVDALAPDPAIPDRRALIRCVADRPGHDFRYAIDASRIAAELGWAPRVPFDVGLRDTVGWYVAHQGWCRQMLDGVYARERLGMAHATGGVR